MFLSSRSLPGPRDIIARVKAALPPDGVLVELIQVQRTAPAAAAHTHISPVKAAAQASLEPSYLAFVLLPSGTVRVADLGAVARIDAAVAELRQALSDQRQDHLAAAQTLYRRVVAPLQRLWGKPRRLFISPDGKLDLVPFDVFHDGQRALLDRYEVSYLTSGRDLLAHATAADDHTASGSRVVVFADPALSTEPSRSAATTRQGQNISDLQRLPGTREEARIIERLFPDSQLLLGAQATASALFQVAAPRLLHIATHGFFLQPPAIMDQDTEWVLSREWDRALAQSSGAPPQPKEPMLCSGLITAGNRPVTALELSGLDLWGTELVVLSACDTGLGQTEAGQGVYGLRRAFLVAGAETVVTSLWKIEDALAPVFMEHYYRGLVAGQGRSQALHNAMRKIRETHPHPYYWAPFIVVGNAGPLEQGR